MNDDQTRITIPGTQVHLLTSTITGQEFKISLWLPPSYDSSSTNYPVVYFLDGFLWAAMYTEIARSLQLSGEIPELILVGIDANTDDFGEWAGIRNKNLTPPQVTIVGLPNVSGEGEAFFRFLSEELIPFVETEFRADAGNRTLAGQSLGGIFALYVLFTHGEAFQNYLSFSPPLFMGDRATFKYEETYASSHTELPVKLFLAVGSLEDDNPTGMLLPNRQYLPALREFTRNLENRRYEGLTLKSVILDGETHMSMSPVAFSQGLRWLFGKKPLTTRLTTTIIEQGLGAALEEYRYLRKNAFDVYDFSEASFNRLGYALLFSGRMAEAIEFFKLNIEAYPDSANVYDSLGEAYLAQGDQTLAREYYQKALAINPRMPSALQALEQLTQSE